MQELQLLLKIEPPGVKSVVGAGDKNNSSWFPPFVSKKLF